MGIRGGKESRTDSPTRCPVQAARDSRGRTDGRDRAQDSDPEGKNETDTCGGPVLHAQKSTQNDRK
jgi:hypothetical protein